MGKNDRDVVARRELAHALEALGDGIGHDTWGPGPVIERLSKRDLDHPGVCMAVEALEAATMATHDLLHRTKRDDALVAIRRLAPVFLELIIEKDGEPKPRYAISGPLAAVIAARNFPLKYCADCGVKCGIEYPNEPTVGRRPDGVIRCNDCEAFAQSAKPRTAAFNSVSALIQKTDEYCRIRKCISCSLEDVQEPSVRGRVDGFVRCNDCWRECGGEADEAEQFAITDAKTPAAVIPRASRSGSIQGLSARARAFRGM